MQFRRDAITREMQPGDPARWDGTSGKSCRIRERSVSGSSGWPAVFTGRASAGRRARRAIRRLLPKEAAASLGKAWPRMWARAYSILSDPLQLGRWRCDRDCPICGYRGRFWSYGSPPRADALCPHCLSLERHRLLELLLKRQPMGLMNGRRLLHFAPEPFVSGRLSCSETYVTADISGSEVDCRCALEAMPFSDDSFDALVANHVLEHVADERKALQEIGRVLTEHGIIVLSVPIVHGWKRTYEDDRIKAPAERRIHFGQEDHRRFYGQDFTTRIRRAGFVVEIFRADPRTEVKFGLKRGDQLFIARPHATKKTEAYGEHPR